VSVEVDQISKSYGTQKAVACLSFKAEEGEIMGFLGPNGAGKSTTMKIITGYLPAEGGTVRVAGLDPMGPGTAGRRKVGYLPENNPLYTDMYVREYLAFVAGIYKLPNVKQAVAKAIAMTGLEPEKRQKIGNLSKGYRQRVGLAQALIHDPEILILDEPTSGLDPNQLADIRTLIKELGAQKTVIFSTHIMQEVEAVCDRVVILHKGKKVADSKVTELLAGLEGTEVFLAEFQSAGDHSVFQAIAGVIKLEHPTTNSVRITARCGAGVSQEIFKVAVEKNLILLGLRKEESSLEEVFNRLTR